MPKRFLPQFFAAAGAFLVFFCGRADAQSLSEFRKQYLKAESFEETKMRVDPSSLKSVFYQILRDVIQDEPDNTANIVLHTNKLILRNVEERGSFKPVKNGSSYIEGFLTYYESVIESLDIIGVRVRTYRADRNGQIPWSGYGNNAQKFALFGHFLQLGGNYDTLGAIEELMTDLRFVCGEGESIFLAPYFFDFAYNLRPAQRDAIAEWAVEQSRDPDLTISGIGSAIHIGFSLFEKAGGMPIDSREILRGYELDRKLIEILRNQQISIAWRAGFTSMMGRSFRDDMSEVLRMEIGNVLTQTLAKQANLSGPTFSYSIAAFLRGNAQDAAWISQAEELISAWEKRASESLLPATRRLEPGGDWIVPMMELICKVGTEYQIKEHFRRFCFDDLVYPGIWINLVRSGNHNLANQARLKQGLLTDFSPDHFQIDTGFDKELAEAIPAYLKTISGSKDRVLAELTLLATPNPPVAKDDEAISPRQQRFDEFAAKHDSLPSWKENHEVRALEILSHSQRNPKIREWVESRQVGLEERIEQDEPRIRPYWAGRIEMHSAAEELESGSLFPIELWWGRAVKDDNHVISRRRGDLCRAILTMMDERMTIACQARDKERLEKFLRVSRSILESIPEYVYRSHVRQFTIRAINAHALCGRVDDWNGWWNRLDPVRKRHLASILTHSSELIPLTAELLNPEQTDTEKAFESADQRRALLKDILSTSWVNDGYEGYSNLANASSRRLLESRDLPEIADAIARSAPRKGSSWREYLGILSDLDQLEEALRIVDVEIEQMEEDDPLLNPLKIEKMLILQALDRSEDADEIRSGFQTTDLDLPREYQAIARYLKKR